jgi:outer membrane protein assembly factor BamB
MRNLLIVIAALALVLALVSVSAATASPSLASSSEIAVAYQINPLHSGDIAFSRALRFPLRKRWSIDLGGMVSYPLIAGGKVFVTVSNSGTAGTKLYALDESSGQNAWGPVDLGGTRGWSNAAFDNGRVFAVNYDGLLRAFDAGTGAMVWSTQLPEQTAFSSPPTAANGIVYTGGAGSGGTVYAVDESNGNVLWTSSVANGDHSSPAVSSSGVYVSYACAQTYDFDPLTGSQVWHYAGACEGGGGRTPVLYAGYLFVRDWLSTPPGYVFNAGTGSLLARFQAGPAPAFREKQGFVLDARTLKAIDPKGNVTWSFAGDGSLSSAPMVVDQSVYVGSTSGNLYALNASTGKQVWSGNVGAPILAPDEQNVSQPLTGLGAGDRMIVIPASNLLVAYR